MRISISLWCHSSDCDPARSRQDPQANDFALCGNYKKKLLLPESHGDFPPTPFLNHSLFKGEQVSWLGITKSIKPVSGSVPFLRSVGKTQGQLSEATSYACQGSTQEAGALLSLAPKAYYRDTDGASPSRKLPLNL